MTFATSRRSSIRPLVQEPMKTVSISMSCSRVPGVSPMYSSDRRAASTFPPLNSPGSGTTPVIGSTSSGLVPQVTTGAIRPASSSTSRSNRAPSSVKSVRQYASAISKAPAFGACGRPLT